MAELKAQGHNIVVTHGNGPQVGNIIAQNEAAKDIVEPLPINACNAESQGFYRIYDGRIIKNHLKSLNIDSNVVTLLTMVEVDKDDPAFNNPTKPIGVFFDEIGSTTFRRNARFCNGRRRR